MSTTTFKGIGNNIAATLSASITAIASSCVLQSGEGAAMPATPFWGTIFEDDPEVNEIVLVTNRSTDTLTITRGQQGTSANSWNADANFQILMTASNLTDIHTAVNELETRLGNGTGDVTITTGDLDVARSGAALNVTWDSYYGGAANVSHDFRISRGTLGTPTIVQNADEVDLNFWGHDGSAWRQFATIAAYINGTPGSGDMPGALAFKVSADGSATPVTALTIAQNLLATFAGAVSMASTLAVTGAMTCSSTISANNNLATGTGAGTANRELRVIAGSGYFGLVRFLGWDGVSANVNRWAIGKENTSESGSSAGSNFVLAAYTDAGVFIDYVVSCARATGGTWTFNRPVTLGSTNALAVGGDFSFNGNGTFGNASTDTITCTGRLLVRSVTDAGPMTATGGTQREIVFNTSNSRYYGCTVTHATAATWAALN